MSKRKLVESYVRQEMKAVAITRAADRVHEIMLGRITEIKLMLLGSRMMASPMKEDSHILGAAEAPAPRAPKREIIVQGQE